ncbi:hypothetical protein MVEN_00569900 [Mycena venus]|uniref:Chromo domain-containing protein n=1 Tax=Mycena venus TaxID=2733690 RepID=A0A8H6YNH2_9AGAR|nr:hypothetical protein MVEN_00569900 [Mycena venus]
MPKRPRNDERYFVEVILKARRTNRPILPGTDFLRSPAWEYYIKWAGYEDVADLTWEPISSLSSPTIDCRRLLVSFWEEVGIDTFLINQENFEVEPTAAWISREKLYFATHVSLDEVLEQNRNPKRKRSTSRSTSRRPSGPSTPSRLTRSPDKMVSFSPVRDERVIPSLNDVENTAQWHRSAKKRAYDLSDSDDDVPIETNVNTSPTGIKIRIPRPSLARPSTPAVLQDTSQTPENSALEQMSETEPDSRRSLFSPPPRPVSRGIKFYDAPITPSSKLATKQRLATASVAPGIPRASPTPDPASSTTSATDVAMDVDDSTLVSDENIIPHGDGEIDESPMLESIFVGEDVDPAGTGFYGVNEDRYAGLRNNNDPLETSGFCDNDDVQEYFDFERAANAVSSDDVLEFLDSVQLKVPVHDCRPSKPIYYSSPMQQWAWHGLLSVSFESPISPFQVVITDSTESAPPRIANFVPSKRPLEFKACYDINDILMFLGVCKRPHQFARLAAKGSDIERLKIFSDYLAKKTQAVIVPAPWDGRDLGIMLFVPPTTTRLLHRLQTPQELCHGTGLVVILLYFRDPYPFEEPCKKNALPLLKRRVERALFTPEQWRQSLQKERDYHVSLRIIQLPKTIREYVHNHASTVWDKCTSGGDDREDRDTRHLLRVLTKSRVGVVPPADPSADVIFIHVGALKNVHNLPHLAQRRLRPNVRFYLYGTHETVPPSRWGFRDIYQLGGVVTFTPEALVDDAWSVLKTIRLIHAHPLWTCYLIPQVVGMAVKLSQLREDEMPEYTDALPYILNRIFAAIQKGEISLTTTPNHLTEEKHRQWVFANSVLKPRTTAAILEHCTKAFDEAYAPFPQENWSKLGKNDVLGDMRRMQIHPAALTDYRRFVVLDSSVDLRYNRPDGIEWNTVGTFDFQDDFVDALEKLSLV